MKKTILFLTLSLGAFRIASSEKIKPVPVKEHPIYKKYMDPTKQKEYADAQWYIKNLLEYMQDPDQDRKNTKEKWGLRLFSTVQFFNEKYVYKNLEKLPADLLYLLLYEIKDHSGKTALELLDENPNFYNHKHIVQLSNIAKNRIDADKFLVSMINEKKANKTLPINSPIESLAAPTPKNPSLSNEEKFERLIQLYEYAPFAAQGIADNIAHQAEDERFTTSQSADDVIASYKKELDLLAKEREIIKTHEINETNASIYNMLGQKMQEVADQITADSSPVGKAALELGFKEQALEQAQQALRITNNTALRNAVLDKQIDYQKVLAQLNRAAIKHPDYQSQKVFFKEEYSKTNQNLQRLQDYKNSYKKMFDDAFANIAQQTKNLPKNKTGFYKNIEPSYTMPAYMVKNSNDQKNNGALLKDLKKLKTYITKMIQKLFGDDHKQKEALLH